MPSDIFERFSIELGYKEPEEIFIKGKGISPAVIASLPRIENEGFKRQMEEVRKSFTDEKKLKELIAEIKEEVVEQDLKLVSNYIQLLEKLRNEKKTYQESDLVLIDKVKSIINKEDPLGSSGKQPDHILMKLESVADRKYLCDEILWHINDLASQREKSMESLSPGLPKDKKSLIIENSVYQKMTRSEIRFFETVFLATYVCDFENIVLGTHRSKIFKVSNPSQIPLDFSFEAKNAKAKGFTIQPDRGKLLPNESKPITIVYKPVKEKCGPISLMVIVDVKHGPRYKVMSKLSFD